MRGSVIGATFPVASVRCQEKTKFEIRKSKFEIRKSKFENRKSKFENRNSKFENRNSKFENRNSKIEIRNSKIEIRNSKFENLNPKIMGHAWSFKFRPVLTPDTWHLTPIYSMPHIPRCAAPQEPQGPDSIEGAECDDPPTANTDNSFSTLGLSHFLQATLVDDEGTIFSKVVPQSRHLNSKSGMGASCWEYSQSPAGLQSATREFSRSHVWGGHHRCIFCGFSGCVGVKNS
jgi:hypothetical protein